MNYVALALWVAFLIAAIVYTRWARHPRARLLAAYLIFVTVFSVSSFVLFAGLTLLLQSIGQAESLANPIIAATFLAAVFVPAFLLARWQLRKPPRRRYP